MKEVGRWVAIVVALVCAAGVVGAMVIVSREEDVVEEVIEEPVGREKTQAEIDNEDENIQTVGSVVDYAIDIQDTAAVAKNSSNVALVRIEKIEGFGNYNEIVEEYTRPYTYGRMRVLENYKGELPVGETVKFYRNGGVLTAEEYYAGEGEERRAKYAELNVDDPELWMKKTRYMTMGDIKSEVGKTYLVYLVPREGEEGAYGAICAQGGLREVRGDEVLNNFTGEWEKLSGVVEGI